MCKKHTVSELGIILKERVIPSGSLSLGIYRVRCRRRRVTPNGRTSCSVTDVHSLSEKLCDELSIRRLTTSRARTGELEQRLLKLRALNGSLLKLCNNLFLLGKLNCIVEVLLAIQVVLDGGHNKSLLALHSRTYICTRSATYTVHHGNLDTELVIRHSVHCLLLIRFRSLVSLILRICKCSNCSMRTNIGTEVTLNTVIRIPCRNVNCNTALLVSSRSNRCRTVYITCESGNGKIVTLLCRNIVLYIVNKVKNIFSSLSLCLKLKPFISAICPFLLYFHFFEGICSCVNRCPVLLNYVLTLTAVSLLSSILHELISLLLRNNTG